MWSKFDDQFYLNPKSAMLDRDEQDLYFAGVIYCNGQLTDGFIPSGVLVMLCTWAKIPLEANPQALAQAIASRLVEHGFFEKSDGGYMIHDFLDWNISREEAIALKDARSEAGRRGGKISAAKRLVNQANAQALAQANSNQNSTQSQSQSQSQLKNNNALEPEIDLYREVTGLVPDYMHEEEVKRNIRAIQQKGNIPRDEVQRIMAEKFALWCESKTEKGKAYNRSNPKWLEWCVTGYDPTPHDNGNRKRNRPPIQGV